MRRRAGPGPAKGAAAAPDYAQPVLAWRSWLVVERSGELRLRSVVFPSIWQPGRELAAECLHERRRRLVRPWSASPCAEPVAKGCDCGIYASKTLDTAIYYLRYRRVDERCCLVRAVGVVALWGRVVECEDGWRGERAYPMRLYLPRYASEGRSDLSDRLRPYGVPVVEAPCGHPGALAEAVRSLTDRVADGHHIP